MSSSPRKVLSCGVFCYMIEPNTARIYFLLGQERYNNRYPAITDKWADFAGLPNENEPEPWAAAREFVEESMGIVKLGPDQKRLPVSEQIQQIANDLEHNRYTFRVEIPMRDGIRVSYVKRIPWQPEIVYEFWRTRQTVLKLLDTYKFAQNHPNNAPIQAGLYEAYENLPGYLKTHPVLQIEVKNRTVRSLLLRKEYLEKKRIILWSLPKLLRLMRLFYCPLIRNGFTEVLNQVLKGFRDLSQEEDGNDRISSSSSSQSE